MVREFTELQGVVGGLYARAQGEPEEIAWAVYDQYKPLGLDDPIPRNLTGCAVALADKLDSLVACFAVGAIPTGSSDPFALRRAALGIVKIILGTKLPLSISAAISAAARVVAGHARRRIDASEAVREAGARVPAGSRALHPARAARVFAYDEINAAFCGWRGRPGGCGGACGCAPGDPQTKNFPPLAASLQAHPEYSGEVRAGRQDQGQGSVKQNLLREPAELQLHLGGAAESARKPCAGRRTRSIAKALEKISELRPAVDLFFDKVLVMAEDEDVRRNRIALLGTLLKEFSTIADFSELGSEDSKAPS